MYLLSSSIFLAPSEWGQASMTSNAAARAAGLRPWAVGLRFSLTVSQSIPKKHALSERLYLWDQLSTLFPLRVPSAIALASFLEQDATNSLSLGEPSHSFAHMYFQVRAPAQVFEERKRLRAWRGVLASWFRFFSPPHPKHSNYSVLCMIIRKRKPSQAKPNCLLCTLLKLFHLLIHREGERIGGIFLRRAWLTGSDRGYESLGPNQEEGEGEREKKKKRKEKKRKERRRACSLSTLFFFKTHLYFST